MRRAHRHTTQERKASDQASIALVGHHNVGKSVIFQKLTGMYATVSNYPGTTVEIMHGPATWAPAIHIIDTPGIVQLPAQSEDEEATSRVLLIEPLHAILQVGDAKNLQRTLLLTIQLAEMGLPMVLALNMMDEADTIGLSVDDALLSERLAFPVVPTVAIKNKGMQELRTALQSPQIAHLHINYPQEIEKALADILPELPRTGIRPRALGLLFLSGDHTAEKWIQEQIGKDKYFHLLDHRESLQLGLAEPLAVLIQRARLDYAEQLAAATSEAKGKGWRGFAHWLGRISTHPLWGIPILAIAFLAMYWFVGIFGAGTLVDLLEKGLFGKIINPWVIATVQRLVPIKFLSDLLVGQYGLWTMGITYALALILPIITTFFLAFSLLEDSGYLPRLAVMTNRLFRLIGLNGKAVLSMVLGLGCVTMATLTTRFLESKRDRLLAILLLALAIPCSSQLGIVMGMLASVSFSATLIWTAVVLAVFLIVGWLSSHLLPGERTTMLLELPPMRWPTLTNVATKTVARLQWYLKEVIPLFVLGAGLLFLMEKTGLQALLLRAGEPLVTHWLGLPAQSSSAFLLGFLRRDFGATGFFVMESQGLLSPIQVVVAMVTITLFVPCLASVLMIAKERGWRTTIIMMVVIFAVAFLTGGLLRMLLQAVGWGQ
jgi:ferrous iron transport protein B